jgi:hypothetical protein
MDIEFEWIPNQGILLLVFYLVEAIHFMVFFYAGKIVRQTRVEIDGQLL